MTVGVEQQVNSAQISAALNATCDCVTLDRAALDAALARPHLASGSAMFASKGDVQKMQATIAAIEAAAQLPEFQAAVLRTGAAAQNFGPAGAFMGYDFHLTPDGPKLIEVNTNAGGALINAHILNAHRACCIELEALFPSFQMTDFENSVFEVFTNEWRRQRGEATLTRIAIVDDEPETQYLYPEFLLAQRLFEARGIEVAIADAASLTYEHGRLLAGSLPVDLVYNRLVDFDLSEKRHAALARAYADGAVVLTPGPRHHALYADKRNLVLLSDPDFVASLNLSDAHVAALGALPRAVVVTGDRSEQLWAERKRYYFKPASGHGSKAVYRGAKLTKGVWADILRSDYIAQEAAPPSARLISGEAQNALKADIRIYTYDGRVLITAARLYQGQTTNFRTPGGGFAPVIVV
ncbi:hypothetical protein [Hyphococcus sp.]|uniref:hypothetical protein n=1 Tax=Hyphococcus sp. TaxID=2038636 RepID=UPI00207F37E0|nr:MAG: hypothetical protein DHS20C04_01210 [Marinicaulis sp.]